MNKSASGRFEQSFMFHMIRDFFLLLLVVVAVELGIRYGVVLYEFNQQEPRRVDRAAQQLAADVKSIMVNSGGPTAAQTVYPILNRNYDDLGLSIAVVPSEVTVESMKLTRNMDAQGLRTRWPEGAHQEARVELTAEQFCVGCHVRAKVGEVLGTVTVRSYLSRKQALWWHEVRLTAGVLSFNIIVHTIVLFLLLKVRMEPLLSLRSTVAGLSKGVMDLSPRARVKSEDEFGELAEDLNHFLDRITLVVHDLDKLLAEVVAVGGRLSGLTRQLESQLDGLRVGAQQQAGASAQRGLQAQVVAARESGVFDTLLQALDEAVAASPGDAALRAQLARLRSSFATVAAALQQAAPASSGAIADDHQALTRALREMAMLEGTMQTVAESGQRVLRRLTVPAG
jgi:methyl-accepting chemotaxis protein